jgi:hypothetical protein
VRGWQGELLKAVRASDVVGGSVSTDTSDKLVSAARSEGDEPQMRLPSLFTGSSIFGRLVFRWGQLWPLQRCGARRSVSSTRSIRSCERGC